MVIGMYADQTGLFTEDEIFNDNWCEVDIPEWIIRKWYEENGLAEGTAYELGKEIEDVTFKDWVYEVSYGDDTDGLYEYSIKNGVVPKLMS